MQIDQLPVEMLMKIFSFLPTYNEVSLVNKRFYDIACKVNDPNICLWINDQTDSQLLQSMHTSNREISKVVIEGSSNHFLNGDQHEIISVVENFSATIKFLKYRYVTTDESNLSEILSLTPNVERLRLQHFRIEQEQSKRRRCSHDLNLKKLKSLSLFACDGELVRIFNRLPVGILTELRITYFYWNTLSVVLNRQLNIKKLKLELSRDELSKLMATDIFDILKLEYLKLDCHKMNSDSVIAILSKQTKLKALIFTDLIAVDERVMSTVADLLELELLDMNVTVTPVAAFAKIGKLKKLKSLKLQCHDNEIAKFKTLTESDNTSIVTLVIKRIKMSVDLIGPLAKSAPHLKHLKVLRAQFLNATEVDAIMSHFNFVEVLEIQFWDGPLPERDDYFNPKLRELEIIVGGLFYEQLLTQFIAAYPNLKKLKFTIEHPEQFVYLEIRPILDGFTKLESLTFKANQLVVEDLDYLLDHQNNLKFVSLVRLVRDTLTDGLVEKLRAKFGVVNADRDRILTVAVDRYTMNREQRSG